MGLSSRLLRWVFFDFFGGSGQIELAKGLRALSVRLAAAWLAISMCNASCHASIASALKFERLSIEDGLAQAGVLCMVQDSRGFLWFGSQDGLSRYDGYEIRIYRHDPENSRSLPGNYVYKLFVDREDRLWVGTLGGGLSLYSEATDDFTTYVHDPDEPTSLGHNGVRDVFQDRSGRLWIGTSGGLNLFQPTKGTFERYDPRISRNASASQRIVRSIAEDSEGNLWLATFGGVFRFDPEAESFDAFLAEPSNPLAPRNDRAYIAYVDRSDNVWIGSEGGLARWEPAQHGFHTFDHDPADPFSLSNNAVIALFEDSANRFWVGTEGGGLNLLDRETHTFTQARHRPSDPSSLSGDHVYSILEDRTGLLWVGTYSGGANKANPDASGFEHFMHLPGDSSSLSHDLVRAFAESESGIWVGTRGGLDLFDAENGTFTRIQAQFGEVRALATSAEGTVWIGTRTRGLWRLDPSRNNLVRYSHSDSDPTSLSSDSVRSLLIDSRGRLWVGTQGCLDRMDRLDSGFTRFCTDPVNPLGLGATYTGTIYEDRSGSIWIGTNQGLRLWNEADGTFTQFSSIPLAEAPTRAIAVMTILEDSRGLMWLGSPSGLNRFDRATGEVTTYREKDGLPNEVVYGILEDADSRLWMSTNRGLVRFDPDSESFDVFDVAEGAQSSEFNGGAYFKCSQGRLYFGGVKGFNVIKAANILIDPHPPLVQITDFLLANASVSIGDADSPLTRHISVTEAIQLNHTHTSFSFEFAALHFAYPTKIRFAYRMDGFDDDWVSTPSDRRFASYTNLDPGNYTFRVRAANRDGIWSDEKAVSLRVLPSPWRTTQAYLLYGVTAALALSLFVSKRVRVRNEELRIQESLRTSEQRLNLALVGSGDGLWDWNLATDEVFRTRVAEMFGYSKNELPAGHAFRHSLIHPDDKQLVEDTLQAHLNGDTPHFEIEYRMKHRDGSWRWILDRGNIVARDSENRPLRLAGTCKDITERKAVEAELLLWATVFKNIAEGVLIISPAQEILAANQAFCSMTGYPESELVGQSRKILRSGRHSRRFYDEMLDSIQTRGRWKGELWLQRKSETSFLTWTDVNSGRSANGKITHYVMVCTDITQRKQAEQELRYLANYDVLTGLPNRTLFLDRLGHALTQARRSQRRLAVLFADLDRFKQVNDSLGHAAGDLLLRRAARRLLESVRDVDTVARFSGDEFTVLIEDVKGEDEVAPVADRIVNALARPFDIAGHEFALSTSAGVSFYPRDGDSAETLLRNADMAMYRAKEKGNGWFFYSQEMSEIAVHRLQLEQEMREALRKGEFRLLYQPKLDLVSGGILGAEALLRWDHPREGLLEPGRFISLAEDTGLIVPVGEWALLSACADCVAWQPNGEEIGVSVNVSASQLQSDQLYASVVRALDATGLDPGLLILELTETTLMENAERSVSVLLQLKNLGVQISIDDFGTGYSSLSYLQMLPIDELKIDRSFIQDLDGPTPQPAIINAIIAMAESLDLRVVAEGVETPAQLEVLREGRCPIIQGYLVARPVPPEQLNDLISRGFLNLNGPSTSPFVGGPRLPENN